MKQILLYEYYYIEIKSYCTVIVIFSSRRPVMDCWTLLTNLWDLMIVGPMSYPYIRIPNYRPEYLSLHKQVFLGKNCIPDFLTQFLFLNFCFIYFLILHTDNIICCYVVNVFFLKFNARLMVGTRLTSDNQLNIIYMFPNYNFTDKSSMKSNSTLSSLALDTLFDSLESDDVPPSETTTSTDMWSRHNLSIVEEISCSSDQVIIMSLLVSYHTLSYPDSNLKRKIRLQCFYLSCSICSCLDTLTKVRSGRSFNIDIAKFKIHRWLTHATLVSVLYYYYQAIDVIANDSEFIAFNTCSSNLNL